LPQLHRSRELPSAQNHNHLSELPNNLMKKN
jgi:hypothetical protein